jgi:hypothetical protein
MVNTLNKEKRRNTHPIPTPYPPLNLRNWWLQASSVLQGSEKKRLNTLVMLVTWRIWCERNIRLFENNYRPIQQIIEQIKSDARHWTIVSGGHFLLAAI